MSHTKEPWFIGGYPNTIFSKREGGFQIAECDPVLARIRPSWVNAKRIVACVNACANLPEPEKNIRELVEWADAVGAAFIPTARKCVAGRELLENLKKSLNPFAPKYLNEKLIEQIEDIEKEP